MISILILVFIVVLAAANGANDVSKGVATLVGSGVTRYRAAIVGGALTTLVGALVSGLFAERMLNCSPRALLLRNLRPDSFLRN